MAAPDPVDIIDTLARCFFAIEPSFASGGTDCNAFPVAETLVATRTRATLPVKTLHVRNNDTRDPVKSFKSGNVKFSYLLQPAADVLGPGVSVPAAGATRPPLWVLLEALMGGVSALAGTDVVASPSPTTTTFSVTPGHGARLPVGQLILVADPVAGLTPCVVDARSTDAITVWPALSNAPATGGDIVNLPTFYITRSNTKSLRVRIANAQDANYQQEFVGGTAKALELKMAKGELASADFDIDFANYTGPSALGLSRTHVADSMDSPLACRNAVVYIQPHGTTTRVEYPIESMSVKIALGNSFLETLSGGTEGKRAVARTEGLQDTVATIDMEFRADRSADNTWFTDFTHLSILAYVPVDTSTGRRAIVVYAGKAVVGDMVPQFVKGPGNMVKCRVQFQCQLNDTYTGTPDVEELGQAGIAIAIG